jgi:hypothetical protein
MPNPIGLHIQGQDPNLDRAKLIEHCRNSDYTTVTVMDNFDLAIQIKDALPNCVVVHRASDFEPAPGSDPVNALRRHLGSLRQDKRIVIMVNCEQGLSQERMNMYADMIPVANGMGWFLCVGNPSSGSVKSGQGSDPNDWLLAKRLFEVMAAFPGNFLGIHEYTGFFAWAVSNGRFNLPNEKPVHLEWNKDQWHIGRNIQGIRAALKAYGIPDSAIKIVVTEGVIDQMNDIQAMYPGVKSDGWQLLIGKWAEWFPGKHAQDVLADMHIWTWEEAYLPSGMVIGIHVYCYGDASGRGRWGTYRVDGGTYMKRMEGYRSPGYISDPIVVPEITELVNPLASDSPLWLIGTVTPIGDYANLRFAPSSENNRPFGRLEDGQMCLYAHNPAWGSWAQVKYEINGEFIHAWVSTDATSFWAKIIDITPKTVTICLSVVVPADEAESYRIVLGSFFANAKFEVK